MNRQNQPLTRFGVHAVVERHGLVATKAVPSLARKRVSPHTLRHYLESQTMLSRGCVLL
jgi:site-specific recombinase XerD